jgi:hypothetical protein
MNFWILSADDSNSQKLQGNSVLGKTLHLSFRSWNITRLSQVNIRFRSMTRFSSVKNKGNPLWVARKGPYGDMPKHFFFLKKPGLRKN